MTDENKEKLDMQTQSADFDYIYNEYFAPLYRYTLSQTKDCEVAQDLVQTVFFKVLQKFPPDKLPPLPYFFTITRNAIIDYWKKKKEIILDLSATPFATLIDEKADLESALQEKFTSQEITRALEQLNFEQKEILTLRFISDLPNPEISKILSKSEKAIRQLQYRALKSSRGLIKSND